MMRIHRTSVLRLLIVTCGIALGLGALADSQPASQEAVAAYQQALSQWEKGKAEAAVAGFCEAAELAPQWGAPNARLGVIYQLQGKVAESRAQYAIAQAISIGPTDGLSEAQGKMRQLLIENEAYLIYLVNSARLEEGQAVLVPDPVVGVVARRHSEEMRDKNYFSHTSPTPALASSQDRFRAVFGYKPRLIGENVARRWGSAFSLCEAKILDSHHDLMNSEGHRHNILYPTMQWLGVGIAANANGDYWITQVFVEPGR